MLGFCDFDNLLTLQAPAKINLRLKLTGRRSDGYHLLSMFNVTTSLCDKIEVEIKKKPGIKLKSVTCDSRLISDSEEFVKEIGGESNLAFRAAQEFFDKFKLNHGLEFSIHKSIPPRAGFAGGSSDAACLLKFLFAQFGTTLLENSKHTIGALRDKLNEIGLHLGADLPFFMQSRCAKVGGVGEEVRGMPAFVSAALRGWPCVMIVPDFGCSTEQVFSTLRDSSKQPGFDVDQELDLFYEHSFDLHRQPETDRLKVVTDIADLIANDLEPHVCELQPKLKDLLAKLRDLNHGKVSLSGTGSGIFMLPEMRSGRNRADKSKLFAEIEKLGAKPFDAKLLVH